MVRFFIGAAVFFLILVLFACCKAAALSDQRLDNMSLRNNQVKGDGR